MPAAWCLVWMLGLSVIIQSTSSVPEALRRYIRFEDLWSLSTGGKQFASSSVRSVQPIPAN
jgi:hypothetical protein